MSDDQSAAEQGIFSEPYDNKGLIEKAVNLRILSTPHQFDVSNSHAQNLFDDGILDRTFYVERNSGGLNLNLMVPRRMRDDLDGRLFAVTFKSSQEDSEDIYVFPLLKNEHWGVDLVLPPTSSGEIETKGQIRLPLMSIPLEFLKEPGIDKVIKGSMIGLNKSPNIKEAWQKFIDRTKAEKKELPPAVAEILESITL